MQPAAGLAPLQADVKARRFRLASPAAATVLGALVEVRPDIENGQASQRYGDGVQHEYDVKVAHAKGEHVWHVHKHTDEFFLVIDGQFDVALRESGGRERTVELRAGDIFVVPKGTEHRPSSPGGSILMFEPSGTLTTGDRHEGSIPAHVDSAVGRALNG